MEKEFIMRILSTRIKNKFAQSYEEWKREVNEVLSYYNNSLDNFDDKDVKRHWYNNVSDSEMVSMCLGLKDSPFDKLPDLKLEFVDDFPGYEEDDDEDNSYFLNGYIPERITNNF